ncbi:MAG: helix-turn-helix transcriptional regulator [Marinovum sp.]|nr:helix-turn-helix transcriptional regulator [Marinovum sp.]
MSGVAPQTEERWLTILRKECDVSSISDVARKIGYSRPAISLVLSGRYKGGTSRIAAKVIAAFTDFVPCPHLACDISQSDCEAHQSRPQPTSDPDALRHWIACRNGCPYSFHGLEGVKANA